MPATASRPIRFAIGGDTNTTTTFRRINRALMKHDPDFVLIGGDLAYAHGNPRQTKRWYKWLDIVSKDYITRSGRVVPLVLVIGNHEVFNAKRMTVEKANAIERKWGVKNGDAPFFYELFGIPKRRGYRALDFGDYLSLIILDTNHTTPVVGTQTDWLQASLEQRRNIPHVFPAYHVPGWPSVRRFDQPTNVDIRKHWVPLFERHGIRVAFEHHDHAYKRTHPLRRGQIADDGVVYIGDGAVGVNPHKINGENAWYLREARSANHFILVTLDGASSRFRIFDDAGTQIDKYIAKARSTHSAQQVTP